VSIAVIIFLVWHNQRRQLVKPRELSDSQLQSLMQPMLLEMLQQLKSMDSSCSLLSA
jgi:hypothetical protein